MDNNDIPFASDDETWAEGKIPDDSAVLDAIGETLDDAGAMIVSILTFHGPNFDCLITASTSPKHVAKLNVHNSALGDTPSESDLVTGLDKALSSDGLIVPNRVVFSREQNDRYVEVTGTELCVFEEPVDELGREERLSVPHHCHDLTALCEVSLRSEANELKLSWKSTDSITTRVLHMVFGSPPETITVPSTEITKLYEHLDRFVSRND